MNYLDELKSIKGVGTVQEFGSDFAMRIWMDPSKMSQNNITAAEVIAAVSNQNKQIAAGNIGARLFPWISLSSMSSPPKVVW